MGSTYAYRSAENIVELTNPSSRTSQGMVSQLAEWKYQPGPYRSGPFNITNVKYYDRRRYYLTAFEPDVWTEFFKDDNGSRSATYTRYFGIALDRDFPQALIDNTRDRSKNGALNSLRSGSTQMGADMGELVKTLEQVGGTTIQVVKALNHARRGNWGAIPNVLGMTKSDVLSGKFPANRWLEYQYGWKPLVQSIHDGVQGVKDGARSETAYFRADGHAHDSFEESVKSGTPYPTQERYQKWDIKCATRFYYRVANSTIDSLDKFGLLNPLSIAWELTPFSFALDWFIPIGNVLSALSAPAGLTFVSGYTNQKITATFRNARIAGNPDPNQHFSRFASSAGAIEAFGRTPFTGGFPLPSLYANTHPFSTVHVANALALIRGLFI